MASDNRVNRKKSLAVTNRYKLVVVGDGACGKTSLLTIFKTEGATEKQDEVELTLWDTAGQESYEKLRPLSYPGSDVVLICYSIDRPESLANVETLWAPEIKRHCRDVPVVLVGNKTDLRESHTSAEDDLVTSAAGTRMSNKIKATCFLECSAKANQGVSAVFQTAAKAAIIHRHENLFVRNIKKTCLLI
ncbi:ras-like GTP-binding protein Rho1 isoform X2 [Tigriopus californicus]|uniref:ras-like GTP-binding protein Rho1 isoform X2 n=1 Tax=Tigriopus californicus TaxID=6832 RepID=UPI0027DA2B2E|nr:ras-like GTP-binding protein Rho1 isoform X2 [Tigriopus californicus]|eukprot:TCALIF_06593-PA protein Name:"Similar to Rho1 Ras-like GTP-binding protein Rho1 (Drosophila melanogaster)" AED:0.08 eAED:0.08 QI:219/1/1/1/0.33/0.25/4/78/189